MLSTSLISFTFALTPCSTQAITLQNAFIDAIDTPVPVLKHQYEYHDANGSINDIKEVETTATQSHLPSHPVIENPTGSFAEQVTSFDLAKALDPTYRQNLFNIANEIEPSILNRALGFSDDEKQLPTQAFGDIIRFNDSFSNGDIWRDVFADSGR